MGAHTAHPAGVNVVHRCVTAAARRVTGSVRSDAMGTRRLTAIAARGTVMLALLASACNGSDDDGYGKLPPAEPTSTAPSAAPRETPPAMPPEARTNTPAGAKAFVRHWFNALNFAYRTGNTEPLRKLSSPSCDTCVEFSRSAENIYRNGSLQGGQYITSRYAVSAGNIKGAFLVSVLYKQTNAIVLDAAGRQKERLASTSGEVIFELARNHDGWSILSSEEVQS